MVKTIHYCSQCDYNKWAFLMISISSNFVGPLKCGGPGHVPAVPTLKSSPDDYKLYGGLHMRLNSNPKFISRRVVYNRSSDQILLPRVFAAEPEERLPSHLVNARLNLHGGSKIATSFEHTPKNSVVDLLASPCATSANNQKAELSQSLFDSSISATAHNAQAESLKSANDTKLRTRASSVDQISRVPHPQIKFVKDSLNTFQDY